MMKKTLSLMFALLFVLTLLPIHALAIEVAVLSLDGIDMSKGKYLHVGATSVSDSAPADASTGYAHLSADGKVLTLHNYSNSNVSLASVLLVYDSLTLMLEGENKLTTQAEQGNAILFESPIELKIDANSTGSLTIEADIGIQFKNYFASGRVLINGGTLNFKGRTGIYGNEVSFNVFINGGKLTGVFDDIGIECSNLQINGGQIEFNSRYKGIWAKGNLEMKGGTLKSTAPFGGMEADRMILTGGQVKATSFTSMSPINAWISISCTLPMEEGVVISVNPVHNAFKCMDYADSLQQIAEVKQQYQQIRTITLPYVSPTEDEPVQTPSGTHVPSTGDNAAITFWSIMLIVSAAAVWIIGRKISEQ